MKALVYTAPCEVVHRDEPEPCPGAIGLLAAPLLSSYGGRRVWMAETNALRRDAASRAVAVNAFDPAAGSGPGVGTVELVIDAVGAASTRRAAMAAVQPGGVVLHIGLQDWSSEIDMRKLTPAEIALVGTYTCSTADLRAAARALHEGAFGDLAWVEERPLADGARALDDLHHGRSTAAKILVRP
jgi:alcohol dehydrogenase